MNQDRLSSNLSFTFRTFHIILKFFTCSVQMKERRMKNKTDGNNSLCLSNIAEVYIKGTEWYLNQICLFRISYAISSKTRESQIKGNKALLNESFTTGPVSQELNLGHDRTARILLPFLHLVRIIGEFSNLGMVKLVKPTWEHYFLVVSLSNDIKNYYKTLFL